MTTREQLGDENFVRNTWEHVIVCDGSYRHYTKGTILINWANHQFYEFAPSHWDDAADFTERREREIQEKREEIAEAEKLISIAFCTTPQMEARKRILSLLEAQLKELQKGMKG